MELTMQKCNGCEKTVEDYMNEVGWIHIESTDMKIQIMKGREESGQARMDSYSMFGNETLDFCSTRCFEGWLIERSKIKEEEK